tara:strand:- start:2284 stop:2733 length:450 start_codon:yes stop_codon:yes gene_type:complete
MKIWERSKKVRRLDHLKKWLKSDFLKAYCKFYINGDIEADDFTVDSVSDLYTYARIDDWTAAYKELEDEIYDRYVGKMQCFNAPVGVCCEGETVNFDTYYMMSVVSGLNDCHGDIIDYHRSDDDDVKKEKEKIKGIIFDEVVENYISSI